MDKDRIKGSFKQFSGGVGEAAGTFLGDKKTEAEGKSEKTEGEDSKCRRQRERHGSRVARSYRNLGERRRCRRRSEPISALRILAVEDGAMIGIPRAEIPPVVAPWARRCRY